MKKIQVYLLVFFTLAICLFSSCNSTKVEESENEFSISMNISTNPQSINPLYYSSSTDIFICRHLFQPLLSINDSFNDYVPILAEKLPEVKLVNDKTAIHYSLKPEAKWDNGTSVNSDDVITSFKIVFNPHSELPYLVKYYDFIDSIIALNELEFYMYINSEANNAYFNSGDFEILPKYIFDQNSVLDAYTFQDLKNYNPNDKIDSALLMLGEEVINIKILDPEAKISGTGAYKITDYNINNNITLTKKQDWWGQKYSDQSYFFKSNPDNINFKIYLEPLSAIMDYNNSNLDVLFGLNHESLRSVLDNQNIMDNSRLIKFNVNAFVYLSVNSSNPLFQNVSARKAMAILSDPNTFIKEILMDQAVAISSPVSPNNKRLYNSNLIALEFDPDNASMLLEKAGWVKRNSSWYKNNQEISLEFLIQAGNKNSEDYGIYFKNKASKIGLKVNLIPLEFSEFISRIRNGNYTLARLGTSVSPMFDNHRALFHSSSIGQRNYPRMNSPEIDSLIGKIEIESNPESKRQMIHTLQELIFHEFSYVFLYSPISNVIVNNRYDNFTLSADALRPWLPAFTLKR